MCIPPMYRTAASNPPLAVEKMTTKPVFKMMLRRLYLPLGDQRFVAGVASSKVESVLCHAPDHWQWWR